MPPLAEVAPWCRITVFFFAALVFNGTCIHFNHLKDVSRFNVASLEALAKQALQGVPGGLALYAWGGGGGRGGGGLMVGYRYVPFDPEDTSTCLDDHAHAECRGEIASLHSR
jgi:hypothetical protein